VRQIVWRQRYGHTVTEDHADSVFTHASAELRPNDGPGISLHFELPAGEDVRDYAVELHMIVATQRRLLAESPTNAEGNFVGM
jgi:hypothetical protein